MVKQPLMAATLLAATALAVNFGAQAQTQKQMGDQNAVQSRNDNRNGGLLKGNPRGPTVSVAPAAEIVGKRIIGSQESDAGRVHSVIVDTTDGKLDYIVLSGSGSFDLNGQVVAVPWSAIDEVDARGPVRLAVDAEQLSDAPRFSPRDIYRLTSRDWRDRIDGFYSYGFWGYGAPERYGARHNWRYSWDHSGQGMNGRSQNDQNSRQASRNRNENWQKGNARSSDGQSDSSMSKGANDQTSQRQMEKSASKGSTSSQNEDRMSDQRGSNQSASRDDSRSWQSNAGEQMNDQRSNNSGDRHAGSHASLSVTEQGVMSVLNRQSDVSSASLRQATVYKRNGDELGDIDHVMIDTDRGRVAFVLIKDSGFLGLNPTWYAAPIEALNARPYEDGYRLQVDENALRGLPTIPAISSNLATEVSQSQLAQLYRKFDVKPYWTNADNMRDDNTGNMQKESSATGG